MTIVAFIIVILHSTWYIARHVDGLLNPQHEVIQCLVVSFIGLTDSGCLVQGTRNLVERNKKIQ